MGTENWTWKIYFSQFNNLFSLFRTSSCFLTLPFSKTGKLTFVTETWSRSTVIEWGLVTKFTAFLCFASYVKACSKPGNGELQVVFVAHPMSHLCIYNSFSQLCLCPMLTELLPNTILTVKTSCQQYLQYPITIYRLMAHILHVPNFAWFNICL